MPVEKVSLTLESDLVAEARAESGGNLSAYVNEALAAKLRRRRLRRLLDEFWHEFGSRPAEEEEAYRREVRDAFAAVDAAVDTAGERPPAGSAAVEAMLARHPAVEEAAIAVGPGGAPLAYVVVADEGSPIGEVSARLRRYLRRRLGPGPLPLLVIVPRRALAHRASSPLGLSGVRGT